MSLRGKFNLFMLFSLLLTMGVAYWTFNSVLNRIELELGKSFTQKQVLYDRERSLRPILHELALADLLTKSPLILKWAKNENNPALKKQGLAQLERFRHEFQDHSYFFALKESGNYYFNDAQNQYAGRELRYRLHRKDPENAWFYKTMQQDKPCLLNVDYDEQIKVTKLWINCVIQDQGEALGILGTGIELTSFIQMVIHDADQGTSNFFMDESGAIQAHRNTDLIDFRSISKSLRERHTVFHLIRSPADQGQIRKLMERLRREPEGSGTLQLKIDGKRYLVGLAYIEKIGWYNVTLMEIGSWVDHRLFTPLILLLALALACLAVISRFAIKWLLLDRINKLEHSAKLVSEGQYEVQADQGGYQDEIGSLYHSFARMVDQIKENTQNLEQRVNERTNQLKRANQEKDRLFAILAHDLRAPIGSLASLFNGDFKPEDLADPQLMQMLKTTTGNTYELLESLLYWSKSQQEKFSFSSEPQSLKQSLTQAIKMFEMQVQNKELQLELKMKGDLFVMAEATMLSIILRNLLHNAIKFSTEGGLIVLDAQEQDGRIEISVMDQGVGMNEQTCNSLFEPDQARASQKGTQEESGSGLGLVLCYDFVKLLGGEIGVQSKQGEGSRFWVRLPRA